MISDYFNKDFIYNSKNRKIFIPCIDQNMNLKVKEMPPGI